MKISDRLMLTLIPPMAAGITRLLNATIHTETLGEEHLRGLWERGERAILAFWHDQLLLMVFGYPGRDARLLISSSKDGELLVRTMRFFKHQAVRGSSSRGGPAAYRQLLQVCREDAEIVLTPDGPKGPRHELKDGVVQLARMSGRAVVPMAFACSRGKRFNSWDRFLLPYPFSRGVFSFGTPVYFDRNAGPDVFRTQLIQAIEQNQQCAERYLESHGVSAV